MEAQRLHALTAAAPDHHTQSLPKKSSSTSRRIPDHALGGNVASYLREKIRAGADMYRLDDMRGRACNTTRQIVAGVAILLCMFIRNSGTSVASTRIRFLFDLSCSHVLPAWRRLWRHLKLCHRSFTWGTLLQQTLSQVRRARQWTVQSMGPAHNSGLRNSAGDNPTLSILCARTELVIY